MYTPPPFQVDDATAAELLSRVEAADLVTMTDAGLAATFLPLLFDRERGDRGALHGHLARKNEQWRIATGSEALVIVHGESGYVSPSYYASKAEHGRVVPTWNYTTAHVYGSLVVHDDPAWVDENVRRLTERHESRREPGWQVDDAPPSFHAGQLRAIVGVELLITRVETKFKLSQNRPAADIDGVIAGLEHDGNATLASAMRRARP